MKRILLPAIAVFLTAVGCTDKKPKENVEPKVIDTLVADWDETSAPMPIHQMREYDESTDQFISRGLRHIFDSQEDSALYAPIAASYKTVFCDGASSGISFTSIQEGKEWGSIIEGKYSYCMKGLNYSGEINGFSGFAFNDKFLETHEVLALKYPENSAPAYVLDSLKARYGNDILSSYTCATTMDEQFTLYSVQMQPKDGKCLGMRVVSINGSLYTYEEWAEEYNDMSAWHVDDGGDYYPFQPIAITKSEKGYDIFYYEGAPESSTFSVLMLRNGKFESYDFACYYHYIDYTPTPDPCPLPEGSELKAELDGYKVWIHTDTVPTEDDPAGVYSVYYSAPESNAVYFVVQTGQNREAWQKWENENEVWVPQADVQSATDAFIVKHPQWDNYYLIIQGCADMRNTMTYISYLPIGTIEPYFRWMRTNSGFQGVDESGKLLKFENYGYYSEGGRYTICRYYDFDFNLVKEEPVEE